LGKGDLVSSSPEIVFFIELVPQDPNDEPASVLLERIKAERAAASDEPRQRKQKKIQKK